MTTLTDEIRAAYLRGQHASRMGWWLLDPTPPADETQPDAYTRGATDNEALADMGFAVREADQRKLDFDDALEAFKHAAARLSETWNSDVEVRDYPAYLPSFDEFAVEVSGIERVR